MLTTLYGLFVWACISGVFFVWLLPNGVRKTTLLVCAWFAPLFLLALIPFWRETSLAEFLYGLFDLPSSLFVTLVVMAMFRQRDAGLNVLWHLAGLTSLVSVLYYLMGDPALFEFGYERQSLALLLGFFAISLIIGSASAMVVVMITAISAALNLMDTHNSWLYVSDSVFAVVWVVKLPIDLLYHFTSQSSVKRTGPSF